MVADFAVVVGGGTTLAGVPATVLASGTDRVLAEFGNDLATLLSPTENQRAAAFRFESDRADFLAAHVLARICVAYLLGASPGAITLAQRCDSCGGEHGRPYVVGRPKTEVSWSHARGYVTAAAAPVPVGVDVEVVGHTGVTSGLIDTVLDGADAAAVRAADEPERAFLRQWTRRECLVKLGSATLTGLGEVGLAGLPLVPAEPPRWRPWREDLEVLDWWDGELQAVGAAILQLRDRPG
jgi:4'-phosphopantetheinyl transferase